MVSTVDTALGAAPPRTRRLAVAALAVIAVLALAYALSPAIGAARLLEAARSGDLAGVEARVSFAKLRRSVARQLVSEAVQRRHVQGAERQLVMGAGTASVAPRRNKTAPITIPASSATPGTTIKSKRGIEAPDSPSV